MPKRKIKRNTEPESPPKRQASAKKCKASAPNRQSPASEGQASSTKVSMPSGNRLKQAFFDQPCVDLSKALLGKRLVRKLESGVDVWGVIVETEAYLGGEDKAAHSFDGKRTERNAAMYMDPGTIYVYHIYGTYTCINFSSKGEGAAVLIRAIDMEGGLEEMRKLRSAKKKAGSKPLQDKELGNGPSKLTQAMAIDKNTFNKEHNETCPNLWLEEGIVVGNEDIVTSARIGIDSAGEKWANAPLRFYVKGNKSVSKLDKKAEEQLKKAQGD